MTVNDYEIYKTISRDQKYVINILLTYMQFHQNVLFSFFSNSFDVMK